MKKKIIETPQSKSKVVEMVTELSYRIFEISDEGHFREPSASNYGGMEYTFEHYSGYPTLEAAQDAVREEALSYAKTYKYAPSYEYIILPIIKTR